MKQGVIKRFTGDLLYGIVSLVVMNMVLTFGVYPYLNRQLGDEGQGEMLFFTALMGLIASAVGSGINYGRMKASTRHTTHNGDYNRYLLALAALSAVVAIAGFVVKKGASGASLPGIAALIFVTAVRYYADVEYRLYMNYRGFFFYYLIVAAGYAAGMLLYPVTGSWVSIFLCGELAGILYVGITGHIFKGKPFEKSGYYKEDAKACVTLSASFVMSDFVSYADRILLSLLVNDTASNYFYVASLVGKMTSLLSTPLNGVITGHLSHYQGKMTKKMYASILGAVCALAVAITGASVLGSHIFVWLLYRDKYEAVKSLFLLANAGQVFFFLSNTMMVVVLRIASERYQFFMGIVYDILFLVIVLPSVAFYGIRGAAVSLFTVNILKFILIGVLGFWALGKEPGYEES